MVEHNDKFIITVQICDTNYDPTDEYNLKDLINNSTFEKEFLNEHLIWNTDFINSVNITNIKNNTEIIVNIKYTGSLGNLITYLNYYRETYIPYSEYLNSFYKDKDGNQCALFITSFHYINYVGSK